MVGLFLLLSALCLINASKSFKGFFKDNRAFGLLLWNSLRLWYYASISTCCQNLEKNGATEKIFKRVKLLRDLTEKSVNFSTLATSSIRLLLVFGEGDQ